MEFRPSIISLLSLQKILFGFFTLLIPLIVFILTQNKLFTVLCAILCVPALYFWSLAFFLQKIKINGSQFIFYDPGAHLEHYFQKMKRISRSNYIFDLSSIENLFITIETNGRLRYISFFDNYTKLKESRKIFNLNLKQKQLFIIAGLWTDKDLDKIYSYIKKSNPHLKVIKEEYV